MFGQTHLTLGFLICESDCDFAALQLISIIQFRNQSWNWNLDMGVTVTDMTWSLGRTFASKGVYTIQTNGFRKWLGLIFLSLTYLATYSANRGRPMRLAFCDGIGPQTGRGHIAQWLESPWTSGAHWGLGQGWATSHTADTQWVPEQLPKRDSQIVWTTGVDAWMPMLRCSVHSQLF